MSNYIAISDARATLPDIVEKVNKYNSEVIITVNGKPKVVMMSLEELEAIEETAGILASKKAIREIRQGLKEAKKGLGIPLSQLD